MPAKIINPGDEIDSYCTTCKLVLAHQVVALVDGNIERVICKTCGKQHKYRPHPPKSKETKSEMSSEATSTSQKEVATTAKKTSRIRKTKDSASKWEELFAGKDVSHAKIYSMNRVFAQDDIIEHKQFGYGLVTEIRAEGKMKVVFKEGLKLLACGRKAD